jgi:Ala-tRNA(Pro) deacylase
MTGMDSPFEKIKTTLRDLGITFSEYEHEPVYTSQEAAEVRGTELGQGAKAMVCLADKKPILLVISAAYQIDTKKFKQQFDVKDMRFATKEEVLDLTGMAVGAVSPFGSMVGLPTYMDVTLQKYKEIVFNAGLNTKSIQMSYDDYIKVENPIKGDFARLPDILST